MLTLIPVRNQADRLNRRERSCLRVPAKHIDRRGHLQNAVGPLAVGMKAQSPRTRAGIRFPLLRIVPCQHRHRRVQFVNVDAIQPQVIHQHKPVIGSHRHPMRMRHLLPLGIWTMPRVLQARHNLAQPAARLYMEGRRAPARVVRAED